MKELKNLVGGELVAAASGATIDVTNPARPEELVGTVPSMGKADLNAVFAAAEAGAKVWRRTGRLARGTVLLNAATLIREQKQELIELIVAEMGKTKAEATGEVTKTAEFFEYYGSMGRDDSGQYLPDARPNTFASRFVEPLGVVLLITPWNDPLLTPARKLGPALISGNAVIMKPATVTPLVALALAEILNEAGLPAGVLGTVTGRVSEIGDALFDFDALKAVSFTGSTKVGKELQQRMSSRGVRVQTEMGGKNASVVLNDADLELAIPTIISAAFAQTGQRCTATSRLLVQREIAPRVREAMIAAVSALKVGPGLEEGVDMGPVVDEGSQAGIREHVSRALSQGAEVIAKSELVGAAATGGYFVEPTLLQITTDHDIWAEEVFGPVIGMVEFDTLEEAIDLVNDSSYGLSSSLFTNNLGNAFEFIHAVDTGQVSVNQPTSGWDIHHPFGGFKDSGSGYKEQGHDALTFYTRVKTAAIRTR